MSRPLLFFGTFCLLISFLHAEEKPAWNFTEEELRLFDPPQNASPEEILQWTNNLERPIPEDTSPWGGYDSYRKMVMQMQIRLSEQILAGNPPFELERSARYVQWFPYHLLCEYDKDAWLPKVKKKYEELCRLSRQQGETIGERTALYFRLRESMMRTVIKYEPDFLSEGEQAVAEIDALLEKHPFGKYSEDLYSVKYSFLSTMAKTDPKFKDRLVEHSATMREFVEKNEDKLASTLLFYVFYDGKKFDTLEEQEYGKMLIEKFQAMIDSNPETGRFTEEDITSLRWSLFVIYDTMYRYGTLNVETFVVYLEGLEAKNDPKWNGFISSGYRTLWTKNLHEFSEKGGSADQLRQIFDWMKKYVEFGSKDNYDNVGHWINSILRYRNDPLKKCTDSQRLLYLTQLAEVAGMMEKFETDWKAAGKPMVEHSYVRPIRDYLTKNIETPLREWKTPKIKYQPRNAK